MSKFLKPFRPQVMAVIVALAVIAIIAVKSGSPDLTNLVHIVAGGLTTTAGVLVALDHTSDRKGKKEDKDED